MPQSLQTNWSAKLRNLGTERWTRLDVPGAIGRLIREFSWDKIDGRGQEDVLTTEIFLALGFLPSDPFLTAIWSSIHDISEDAMPELISGAATAKFVTLPGDFIYDSAKAGAKVQPDVIIECDKIVISVEAKRLRSSLFDPTQLARQAIFLSQLGDSHVGYLWVVLAKPPPIKLGKFGWHTVEEALKHGLYKIADSTTAEKSLSALKGRVGWSTWSEIVSICRTTQGKIGSEAEPLRECTGRLVSAMEQALQWHA